MAVCLPAVPQCCAPPPASPPPTSSGAWQITDVTATVAEFSSTLNPVWQHLSRWQIKSVFVISGSSITVSGLPSGSLSVSSSSRGGVLTRTQVSVNVFVDTPQVVT